MDRILPKSRGRVWLLSTFSLVLIAIAGFLVFGAVTRVPTMRVQAKSLRIGTVERGPFREYIAVQALAEPRRTFFLDTVQGGRITEIHAREGDVVAKGDPLLKLHNDDLSLELAAAENRLDEAQDRLQNARIRAERTELEAKAWLAELDYMLTRDRRKFERAQALEKSDLVSGAELATASDDYEYAQLRKKLAKETSQKNASLNQTEIDQLRQTAQRAARNLDLIRAKAQQLVIRAGMDGRLAEWNVEIGQVKAPNQRVGRIDQQADYKLVAEIDQYYLPRVTTTQSGETEVAGDLYALKIDKIYPRVLDGRFKLDFHFEERSPQGLKPGATFQVSLPLSEAKTATLLPRGGFMNHTAGTWIYVLRDEKVAERRNIRLGKQNPRSLEVLEGLEAGERVLLSHYEHLGEAQRVILEP